MSGSLWWQRAEPWLVAMMLAVFCVSTVSLVTAFPVHIDEVSYTDPAASYLLGQGFTSGAWYGQTHDEFWSGNVPLHQLLLIPWFQIFGFSMLAERSINVFYVVAGVLLIWAGLLRGRLIASPGWRLGAVAFLLCSYASIQMLAYGRPDGITFFLVCLGWWGLNIRNPRGRRFLLGGVAFLAPWAGPQLIVAFVFAGFVALLFWRGRFFPEIIAMGIGGAAGTAGLLAFYYFNGTLPAFLGSIRHHTVARDAGHAMSFQNLKHRFGGLTDPSLALLGLSSGLAVVGWWLLPRPRRNTRIVLLCLLCLFGIPLSIAAIGVFPQYYSWMVVLPVTLALLHLLESTTLPPPFRTACIVALVTAASVGTPRVLGNCLLWRNDRVNELSHSFVKESLRPDDVAIIERQAYFPAKATAKRIYYVQWYMDAITEDDKAALTVALMDPVTFERLVPYLGDGWVSTGATISVPQRNLLRLPGTKFYRNNPTIRLAVYRRLKEKVMELPDAQ